MKTFKRLLTAVLALAMVLTMAACGGSPSSTSSSDASGTSSTDGGNEQKEIVTLTVLAGANGTKSGKIDAYWTDIYREDLGIEFDLIAKTNEKLMAYMASDSMPDLVYTLNADQLENAIAGDLILALDDYKEYAPDAVEWGEASMRYQREYASNGTGKAYSVGARILTTLSDKGQVNPVPYIRWDLYKKLGYPELKTVDDFLPLLQKMMEMEPETPDGKKTYGFVLHNLPVGNGAGLGVCSNYLNWYGRQIFGLSEYSYKDEKFVNGILDDDSLYMKALKFFYTANQMGVVNPDSMSMDWAASMDSYTNGQGFFTFEDYGMGNYAGNQEEYQGFKLLVADDMTPTSPGAQPTGAASYPVVGKHTEYVEQAFAALNAYYDPDMVMDLNLGRKGVTWDVDENNKPYVTELGWDCFNNNKELPGGGTRVDGLWTFNWWGIQTGNVHPEYGVTMAWNLWDKKDFLPEDSNLVKDWQQYWRDRTGNQEIAEDRTAMAATGQLLWRPVTLFDSAMTDDMTQLQSSLQDIVTTLSYKMVYAKDEAEFEAAKAEMIATVKEADPEGRYDAYMRERYENAIALGKKFS